MSAASAVRRALARNGLGLVFLGLFGAALLGQAITGMLRYNEEAAAEQMPSLSFGQYVTSSQFAVDVAENWQSEYLQFFLFIVLTVWLIQVGSPESKELGRAGRESDEQQKVGEYAQPDSPAWARAGGWRLAVYARSLGLMMGLIFLLSWTAQLVAGRAALNTERLQQLQAPLGWADYAVSPDFWNRTLQNWQSEFLAVASMVVLAIYLRERGSPESKPVGDPHATTASEG